MNKELAHRFSWQRQLNVIRYLARGSHGTHARARTFDVLNYLISIFLNHLECSLSNVCLYKNESTEVQTLGVIRIQLYIVSIF